MLLFHHPRHSNQRLLPHSSPAATERLCWLAGINFHEPLRELTNVGTTQSLLSTHACIDNGPRANSNVCMLPFHITVQDGHRPLWRYKYTRTPVLHERCMHHQFQQPVFERGPKGRKSVNMDRFKAKGKHPRLPGARLHHLGNSSGMFPSHTS